MFQYIQLDQLVYVVYSDTNRFILSFSLPLSRL